MKKQLDPYHVSPICASSAVCDWCDEGADIDTPHRHLFYVQRAGASTRTADSLAFVFLWDVADLLADPDDENGLSLPYRVPGEISDPDGWYDDPDDAERVQEEVQRAEGALFDAGMHVSWDDGYVIERIEKIPGEIGADGVIG